MIELYLSKVTETSETEQAGKYYARVSYKQTMSVQDMAHHMAEHNTMFSEGSITGILIDFVKCVREQVLMGNTVKIDNLAIFKATVEANALETLYDAEQDKVASASIGTLPEGAKTGAAVKAIKLLAQSTGEFTRDELKKDVRLSWTDKAKAEIASAKGGNSQESVVRSQETVVSSREAATAARRAAAARSLQHWQHPPSAARLRLLRLPR
jgi:predicted histone-like DNA-binding protein